jgi:hypothetical protein
MEHVVKLKGKQYTPLIWKHPKSRLIETTGIIINWNYPIIVAKRHDLIHCQSIYTEVDGKEISLKWIRNCYEWNIVCLVSDHLPEKGILKDQFQLNFDFCDLFIDGKKVNYIKTETVSVAPWVSIIQCLIDTDIDDGIVFTDSGKFMGIMIDKGKCLPCRMIMVLLDPNFTGIPFFPIKTDDNLCVVESLTSISVGTILKEPWNLTDAIVNQQLPWNLYWNINYHVGDVISFYVKKGNSYKLTNIELTDVNDNYQCRGSAIPYSRCAKPFVLEEENLIITYLSHEIMALYNEHHPMDYPIDKSELKDSPMGANIIIVIDATDKEKAVSLGLRKKNRSALILKKIGTENNPSSLQNVVSKFAKFSSKMSLVLEGRTDCHTITFEKKGKKKKSPS